MIHKDFGLLPLTLAFPSAVIESRQLVSTLFITFLETTNRYSENYGNMNGLPTFLSVVDTTKEIGGVPILNDVRYGVNMLERTVHTE